MCVLAVVFVVTAPTFTAAEIAWFQGTFPEARDRAHRTHQPLMLLFYKPGCGPCQVHDSTLAAPEVMAYATQFICMRMDVDTPGGKERQSQMKALGTPVTVFFDWKGEETDRVIGTKFAPDFLAEMKRIRSGRGTVPDLLARASKHPNDVGFAYDLGSKLTERGDDRARIYLNRVLTLDSANAAGKTDKALLSLASLARRTKDYAGCIESSERLLRMFPKSDLAQESYGSLARCHHSLGDTETAVVALERGAAAAPDQPDAWNSLAWNCATWGVHLDRALAAAQKAVDLSGNDVGYLDTLAEVYFARGDASLAVATEKQALEKSPDNEMLRAQLSKFEAASREKSESK